jgi:hypothetical protein
MRSKYKSIKTTINGITFASKREARYYQIYSRLQEVGQIKNLQIQTSIPFILNGKKIFAYKPDFEFDDENGHHIVDVKGIETPVFRLKKKLIEEEYNIEIEVVK